MATKKVNDQIAIEEETVTEEAEVTEEETTNAVVPAELPAQKESLLMKGAKKLEELDAKASQKKAAKAQKKHDKAEAKAAKKAEKNEAGSGKGLKIAAGIGAGLLVVGAIGKAVLDAAAKSGDSQIQDASFEPLMLDDGTVTESEETNSEQVLDTPIEIEEETT